jgi:arsenate reductase (glutaredoxin)
MPKNTYYHNPRCSKSRQGLALLEQNNVSFEIREYLKEGFSSNELKKLFKALDMVPYATVRRKESLYKELVIDGKSLSQAEWIKILIDNPSLMERPILVTQKGARIGRPPENLLEII